MLRRARQSANNRRHRNTGYCWREARNECTLGDACPFIHVNQGSSPERWPEYMHAQPGPRVAQRAAQNSQPDVEVPKFSVRLAEDPQHTMIQPILVDTEGGERLEQDRELRTVSPSHDVDLPEAPVPVAVLEQIVARISPESKENRLNKAADRRSKADMAARFFGAWKEATDNSYIELDGDAVFRCHVCEHKFCTNPRVSNQPFCPACKSAATSDMLHIDPQARCRWNASSKTWMWKSVTARREGEANHLAVGCRCASASPKKRVFLHRHVSHRYITRRNELGPCGSVFCPGETVHRTAVAWSWAQLGPFWALAKLFNGSRVGALHVDAAVTKGPMRATTREETGQPSAPANDFVEVGLAR